MPTTRDGRRLEGKQPVPKNKVADGRTKLTLVIDEDEKEAIQARADIERTTMSEVVRRAMREYCARA